MIKKLFSFNSIKKRLNVSFFLVTFIPLLVITFVFNNIYFNIFISRTIQNSVQRLGLISNNIELLTDSIENYSKLIITSGITQELLRKDYSGDELQELSDVGMLRGTFDNLIGRKNIINSIFILKLRDMSIYDVGNNVSGLSANTFADRPVLRELMAGGWSSKWTDVYKSPFRIMNGRVDTFTMYETVMDMNTGKNIGIIGINVNEKALSSLYANIKGGSSGKYLVINGSGKIMSSSDPAHMYGDMSREPYYRWCADTEAGGVIKKVGGREMLITVYSLHKLPWKIVETVPLDELSTTSDKINMGILATGVALFILTLLVSLLLSNKISKPILHLAGVMKKTGDDGLVNVSIDRTSEDEVGILQSSFNKMMHRIAELIETVTTEQRLKREYELAAINTQVKPHFLYNALNSVLGLLSLKDYEKTVEMVKALGEFYKLSLGRDGGLIRICDELRLTESYIIIQKLKYGDRLNYRIDMPDEIMEFRIPKFSLQPLVENSFKHGFNNMSGRDMLIEITGELAGGSIGLSVYDNGTGGVQELINGYLSGAVPDKINGFGLKSILDRLRLYFGNAAFMKAEDTAGCGTKMVICIPAGGE